MSMSTATVPSTVAAPAHRRTAPWPFDALRIMFGVVWAIDATFKWMPGFRSNYLDTLKSAADGQPSWLRPWFDFWYHLQSPHSTAWAYLIAITETCLAIAVIAGFARKVTYIGGAIFSLFVWAIAEGFGGPYHAGSTDIGTAIIYAIAFALLLAMSAHTGPTRFSADYYIERRWPQWTRIAETRRHSRDRQYEPAAEQQRR
jgi:nitrite reductase (NO-forming)